MRQAIILALVSLGLSTGCASAASLIGEEILVRLDIQGSPLPSVTVGAGPEISGLASPRGYPWVWTVDFGASDFTITAVATEAPEEDFAFFDPDISFASVIPGLIPFTAGTLTVTEQIAVNGLTNGALPGDFETLSAVIVETLIGPNLSFRSDWDRFGSSGPIPVGSFVRWSGTIALAESADVPLPAPGPLLLAGIAALGLVRGRRRA